MDLLCFKGIRNSIGLKLLDKTDAYVRKKLSVEAIIQKLNEVDKIKFACFSPEELHLMKLIQNPSIEQIGSTNKSYIQQLWKKFEFDSEISQEELEKLKKSFSSDKELSKNIENIIRLL
jgi:hypothetical protein